MKSRAVRSVAGLIATLLGFGILMYGPFDRMAFSTGMMTIMFSINLMEVGFTVFLVFGLKQ